MNNLYLVGYRGVGKSTIAPVIAQRLNWQVVELDARIEASAGHSISEIFAQYGEAHFRDQESRQLTEVAAKTGQVISTGGGIVLQERHRTLMRKTGLVCWLKASPAVLFQRLQSEMNPAIQRPALTVLPLEQEIEQLVQQRTPLYEAACHFSVDTETHKLEEVVDFIVQQVRQG